MSCTAGTQTAGGDYLIRSATSKASFTILTAERDEEVTKYDAA
jgi:hypothetical protein